MRMPLWRPERLHAREARWCRAANRYGHRNGIGRVFPLVSRLGDGVFWYALMAALVIVDGLPGALAALHMAATGSVAVALYLPLKWWTRRPRPFVSDRRIRAWIAPLDEFSFPSGHTLHAMTFSIVAVAYYPWLAALLIPFSVGVAISRVVLGLHYPSDVLAATLIGTLLGALSVQIWPL